MYTKSHRDSRTRGRNILYEYTITNGFVQSVTTSRAPMKISQCERRLSNIPIIIVHQYSNIRVFETMVL